MKTGCKKFSNTDHEKKAKKLKMDAEELMMGSNGHQEEGEEVMVVKKMVGEEVEDIEVLQQELVSLDEEAEEKKVAGRKLPSWKPDPLLPAGWKKREVEMQVFVSDFKMYLSQIDKCICLKL